MNKVELVQLCQKKYFEQMGLLFLEVFFEDFLFEFTEPLFANTYKLGFIFIRDSLQIYRMWGMWELEKILIFLKGRIFPNTRFSVVAIT